MRISKLDGKTRFSSLNILRIKNRIVQAENNIIFVQNEWDILEYYGMYFYSLLSVWKKLFHPCSSQVLFLGMYFPSIQLRYELRAHHLKKHKKNQSIIRHDQNLRRSNQSLIPTSPKKKIDTMVFNGKQNQIIRQWLRKNSNFSYSQPMSDMPIFIKNCFHMMDATMY